MSWRFPSYIEHVYDMAMSLVETSGRDVGAEVECIAGQFNAVNARLVAVVDTMLETEQWTHGAIRSPAKYVAWKTGVSPERAQAVVTVAERRSDHPAVIAPFDRGELSLEQVVEAVEAPWWTDAEIADFARICTVTKFRRATRSNLFGCDPDESDARARGPKDQLSFGINRHGRWTIRAELGVDDGRRVEAALAERKDALFDAGDTDVTWREAFVDCFDRSLGAIESISRRDHYRTWFHVDVTSGAMTRTDGWRVPRAVRDHLLCDGVAQPVWERDGVPFSVGRTHRIVSRPNPPHRRATRSRLSGARLRRRSVRRGPSHRPPNRRWADRHMESGEPLSEASPAAPRGADDTDGVIFTDADGLVVDPAGRTTLERRRSHGRRAAPPPPDADDVAA